MANREQMKQTLEQMAFPVYEGRERLKHKTTEKASAEALTVIFLGSDIELEGALKPLRAWKATGKPMIFVFSEAAERLLPTAQLIKKYKPVKVIGSQAYEALKETVCTTRQAYVPNLTQNTAAKLAVGIQDDLPTTLLWQCLATNKIVHAGIQGIEQAWFSLCENPAMTHTMNQHLTVLRQYGLITEIPDYTLEPVGLGTAAEGNKQAKGHNQPAAYTILSDALSQKVITERHILSLEKGSRLGIRKGVKITPLAKEAARKRKIELLQMEEGNNL